MRPCDFNENGTNLKKNSLSKKIVYDAIFIFIIALFDNIYLPRTKYS